MNELPTSPLGTFSKDEEHLKLLAIFHYVFGGLAILGLLFLFVHFMIFNTVLNNPQVMEQMREQMQKNQGNQPFPLDPQQFFALFKWFYLFFGLVLVFGAVINFLSGWFIRKKTNRTYSLVVAGIDCLQIPFGTALGICTIIVLLRDSVRALYAAPR